MAILTSTTAAALGLLLAAFQRWLHMPDTDALEIVLGSYAANRLPGDAVWLMLVGPSSGGKGEILNSLTALPFIHPVGTLTESALLSGVKDKERASDSHGGLLREMGEFGILHLKDFTSVLSMPRETRASVLAALREIYDGAWTRRLGVDGGKRLDWRGKMGLIAGVTEAIDSHHGVMADMGPRFMLYRLPPVDAAEQARSALSSSGHEEQMRQELRSAVSKLFGMLAGALSNPEPYSLGAEDASWLVALTEFATRCRSSVERHPYTREILLVPQPEAPARLTKSAARLLAGLSTIGVEPGRRRKLIRKSLLDCIPPVRRHAIDYLAQSPGDTGIGRIAKSARLPEQTVRTALQDLQCHGVVAESSDGLKSWTIAPRWEKHIRAAYGEL